MKTKKIVSLLAATFVGMMGLGINALAAEGDTAPKIDPATKGSITIHKLFGDETKERNDGTEKTVTDKKPVSGVKYQIEKAQNIDLTTNAGWQAAAAASENDGANLTFEAALPEQTTAENGEAKFTDLAIGLYKVTETDVKDAKVDNKPTKVKTAAPFFITVPLTDPQNKDKWLYDLHVYPKNAEFQVTKTADLSKVKDGKMVYDVYSTLPALSDDHPEYKKYALLDKLGDGFELGSFKVLKVEAVTGKDDTAGTALAESDYTLDTSKSPVKLDANAEGLKKLTAAKKAGKAQVHFQYEVAFKNDWKKGDATNQAFVNPDPKVSDDSAVTDANTPHSDENKVAFVNLKIKKVDSDGTTPLSGAEFDVYACKAGKLVDAKGAETTVDKALKLNNAKLISTETGDSNEVRISSKDNTNLITEVCAVETKAPTGYTLLNEPVVLDKVTGKADVTETIKNVKANAGFKLPLTGSSALIILTVAGLSLIAGSSIYLLRRKETQK